MKYALLCNPLHNNVLHAVVGLSTLEAETQEVEGSKLPKDTILFDKWNEVGAAWGLARRLDEHYWPWISSFIAETEDGIIKSFVIANPMWDTRFQDGKFMLDVKPEGVELVKEGVR